MIPSQQSSFSGSLTALMCHLAIADTSAKSCVVKQPPFGKMTSMPGRFTPSRRTTCPPPSTRWFPTTRIDSGGTDSNPPLAMTLARAAGAVPATVASPTATTVAASDRDGPEDPRPGPRLARASGLSSRATPAGLSSRLVHVILSRPAARPP